MLPACVTHALHLLERLQVVGIRGWLTDYRPDACYDVDECLEDFILSWYGNPASGMPPGRLGVDMIYAGLGHIPADQSKVIIASSKRESG